jgi:hypothetical protein
MLRYLRIAATLLSLTACALFVALWLSSYYWWCYIRVPSQTLEFQLISVLGRVNACVFDMSGRVRPLKAHVGKIDEEALTVRRTIESYENQRGFGAVKAGWAAVMAIPHWFLVLLSGALTGTMQIKRFSLRALLIAMTLVAVLLGAIAVFP